MSPLRNDTTRNSLLILLAAAAWLSSACTTSTGSAPSRVEHVEDGSFTVAQEVRVGIGVRSDFDAAVERLEEGDFDAAIEGLLEVTEAAPQLVAAHLNLAMAYGQLGQWDEAAASAERAVELSPRHPVAHNELGMIRRHQGRFEDARASYERALDEAEDFHFARRNLAILCDLFLKDMACAIENYERYSQAVPEDESVGMWVADLRNRSGK